MDDPPPNTAWSPPPEPVASRPRVPHDYGVPDTDEGLLPWSWAEQRLQATGTFWFHTTRPDGRPHAMPAWGVWLDRRLWFDGSPETRRMRNLAANPAISVHLEDGDRALIVEGVAAEAGPPGAELGGRLAAAFTRLFGTRGYSPEPTGWDEGGLYAVTPRTAFGWESFPASCTRWRFAG
ncbi:nitroimidazol reductase NimA-like FMN-containing flavoprotein (pyridoxamine 5'-phosphate oxidase superfamily) [Friedmanniella endophytica]|uniref:Nitroimidazol reductase NimA-like FMN-containing flavoprotein (Pyridoxamine 5'-phosphate oxidase superfamily) n=1 Tax=Microlunatus kandeliicorticis TaxID=1759536 RepID=A0A7W3ISC5_9ACTN|nr:pyridoxamine 5'-phosphate oxidase family protein [Microlunatus kandeliicorticis]MBA8794363.1 nitroimidazol reductase NimA-like FMN-containing flavoprotein (pyridoxamine 5'-phosphate oxidase superfamily) [Microlunatus kandeliicorticis]